MVHKLCHSFSLNTANGGIMREITHIGARTNNVMLAAAPLVFIDVANAIQSALRGKKVHTCLHVQHAPSAGKARCAKPSREKFNNIRCWHGGEVRRDHARCFSLHERDTMPRTIMEMAVIMNFLYTEPRATLASCGASPHASP